MVRSELLVVSGLLVLKPKFEPSPSNPSNLFSKKEKAEKIIKQI